MNTIEYSQEAKTFCLTFPGPIVSKLVGELDLIFEESTQRIKGHFGNPNSGLVAEAIKSIGAYIDTSVTHLLAEVEPSSIFAEIQDGKRRISSLAISLPRLGGQLISFLNSFENALNAQLSLRSKESAFVLARSATAALACFTTAQDALADSAVLLSPQREIPDYMDELTFEFKSHHQLAEMSHKLYSISALNVELSGLLTKIAPPSTPIELPKPQIVKIETGSLVVKIIVSAMLVPLVKKLVIKAGEIIYRRYILEGKIETEVEYRKHIMDMLDLRNELMKAGFEVEGHDEVIRQVSLENSITLSRLMSGEPSITVNGQTASIGDAQTMAYLQQLEQRHIEYDGTLPGENESATE